MALGVGLRFHKYICLILFQLCLYNPNFCLGCCVHAFQIHFCVYTMFMDMELLSCIANVIQVYYVSNK